MLNLRLSNKALRYTPLLIPQRWKVSKLPKTYDGINETPYMKVVKQKKSIYVDLLSFLHRKWTLPIVKDYYKWKEIQEIRDDQRYNPDRHQTLGPDLATTHFITARGGKIKFVNDEKWITIDDITENRVPSFFVPGFCVEEVDASGMILFYEGFDNLSNLNSLKKLNLSNCPYVDDWCLGRCHLFAHSLEHLDISGCQLISERGICALHPLKKLKTLVINDTPNILNRELVCLLLQDIIPKCDVIGVDYDNPVLRKRVEGFLR